MAAIGRRGQPPASSVTPFSGFGLGLPVTTPMPTRQWERPARRVAQVVPIDWRPQGPERTFGGAALEPDAAPARPREEC